MAFAGESCLHSLPSLQCLCLRTESEFFILMNLSVPGVCFGFAFEESEKFKAGRTLGDYLINTLSDRWRN